MNVLRSFFKIAIIFIFSSVCLLLCVSYIVRKYFEDEVTLIIVNELNAVLNVRVDVKNINFSLFYSFPQASLDFKNVTIYSSSQFDDSQFTEGDKVLFSKVISFRFNLIDLYYRRYDVKSVVLKDTYLWILRDTKGNDNYRIWNESSDSTDALISISLEKIVSENLFCWYDDSYNKLSGFVEDIEFAGQYRAGDLVAVAQMEGNIQSFAFDDFKYVQKIPFNISTNLLIQDTASYFTNTKLQSRNLSLMFDCIVGYNRDLSYVINLKEGSTSFDAVKWFLPDSVFADISDYKPSGDFMFGGKIEKKTKQAFGSANLQVFSKNIGAVYDSVHYNTSGLLHFNIPDFSDMSNFDLKTDAFKITVNSSNWVQLSMVYKNRTKQCPNISFDSQFACNESVFARYLPQPVSLFSGSLSGSVSGAFDLCEDETLSYIDKIRANVEFYNISSVYKDISVSKMNGRFVLDKNKLQFPALQLQLNNSALSGFCIISTIGPLLTPSSTRIDISGKIKADSLDYTLVSALLNSGNPEPASPQNSIGEQNSVALNYQANINFDVGYFRYESHALRHLHADMIATPDNVNYILHSCNTGFGTLKADGNYSIKNNVLDFNLLCHKMDISQVFLEFNNFDQTFLTNKNIKGTLFGRFVGLMPFDQSMQIIRNKMLLTGELTIDDGQLNNFAPLLEMSKYLSESELSSIHFERISNIISIKNDSLFIPRMLVVSSIADLTVTGEQSLDNIFDYRVQVVLNKVLSARRKNQNKDMDEFGEIKDDGLGRTTLPLRIFGNSDNFKVIYDRKAAKEVLKQKWKEQTQELKNILREEFYIKPANTSTTKAKEEVPDDFEFDWND